MTEKSFVNWFAKRVKKHGIFWQRLETTTGLGVPDAFIAYNGELGFVEFKIAQSTGRAKVRNEQLAWGKTFIKRGKNPWSVLAKHPTRSELYLFQPPFEEISSNETHTTLKTNDIIEWKLKKNKEQLLHLCVRLLSNQLYNNLY